MNRTALLHHEHKPCPTPGCGGRMTGMLESVQAEWRPERMEWRWSCPDCEREENADGSVARVGEVPCGGDAKRR